jgi:hypothetical protein
MGIPGDIAALMMTSMAGGPKENGPLRRHASRNAKRHTDCARALKTAMETLKRVKLTLL